MNFRVYVNPRTENTMLRDFTWGLDKRLRYGEPERVIHDHRVPVGQMVVVIDGDG